MAEDASWWQVSESVVYASGILGACPARGATPLTPIDLHPLPRQTVIAWAFAYEGRLDPDRFKATLADVLRDYPLLAGRFEVGTTSGSQVTRAKILHTNAGARVVVGKHERAASELRATPILEEESGRAAGSARRPPWYVNPMDLARVYQGREALLSFRITHLMDGGTMLGVCVPHAVVDGSSLAAFLSALSRKYQGLDAQKPFLDRRVLAYQPLAELCTSDELGRFHAPSSESDSEPQAAADAGLPSAKGGAKLGLAATIASSLSRYYAPKRVHPCSSTTNGRGAKEGGGRDAGSNLNFGSDPVSDCAVRVDEEEALVGSRVGSAGPEDLASTLSIWGALRYLGKVCWELVKGAQMKTVVIKICSEEVQEIKERQRTAAAASASGSEGISRNDIAVACAWILMRKLQGKLGLLEGSDRSNQSRALFAADLRVKSRLRNLEEAYFGNAVLAVDASGPPEMSLLECAAAVRHSVANLKEAEARHIMRGVWRVGQQSFFQSLPALVTSLPCYHDCLITSWQFPFSEITFGLPQPVSLYPGMFPRCPWTAIVVNDVAGQGKGPPPRSPSPSSGGGIYVHMTLPRPAFDLLRSDPSMLGHMNRASITTL